jgi:hypothetical protein
LKLIANWKTNKWREEQIQLFGGDIAIEIDAE